MANELADLDFIITADGDYDFDFPSNLIDIVAGGTWDGATVSVRQVSALDENVAPEYAGGEKTDDFTIIVKAASNRRGRINVSGAGGSTNLSFDVAGA